jgi:hypothetical protein
MFAVVDCEKDVDADGVLMLVGTQGEAQDIARELRCHGRRIDVRPWSCSTVDSWSSPNALSERHPRGGSSR